MQPIQGLNVAVAHWMSVVAAINSFAQTGDFILLDKFWGHDLHGHKRLSGSRLNFRKGRSLSYCVHKLILTLSVLRIVPADKISWPPTLIKTVKPLAASTRALPDWILLVSQFPF